MADFRRPFEAVDYQALMQAHSPPPEYFEGDYLLEPDEIEHYEEYALLKSYLDEKHREIEAHNASTGDRLVNANIRRLTNVGTFRAYIYGYLRNHASIHGNMTLLVRQLNPTPQGLPIEIYCFTNTTDWGAYEDIQSDLMDHLLALAPDFGLRTFQNPSGWDLTQLRQSS